MIYLIGYMGAGKTTVGKIIADKIGWRFVDLDEAFEQIHGMSPAEYIREYGIDAFRYKEKYVLEDIADMSPYEHVVYATGGGYPCYEDNMDCVNELGTTIYIRWTPEDLVNRLLLTDLSTRPNLVGQSREELLAHVTHQLQEREPYYQQAHYTIQAPGFTEDADDRIANDIIQIMTQL